MCFNLCCYEAKNNQYTVHDEMNTHQFETAISINPYKSDSLLNLSQLKERACTETEERVVIDILDLFFKELLRFNYALEKESWLNIVSLSDELHNNKVLEEKYNSIDKYVKEHGNDLNVTSIERATSLCYENSNKRIIRTSGVINYRVLASDGYKPSVFDNLTLGDNPVAYIVFIELSPDDDSTSMVIGWSFRRYNGEQEDFYPEVLQ